MSFTRIDFQTADPARFNQLRDQWRSVALSCALTRSGLRVAGVLPSFVSRQHGYAFPTDEDLAEAIGADKKTAKRGILSLGELNLIERDTRIRRNERGVVVGKQRRIYLTLPEVVETHLEPKGQNKAEPKGQTPKGHREPKGQNGATEGTPGCPYILDSTPDGSSAYETGDPIEGTYTGTDPSVGDEVKEKKAQPHSAPSPSSAAAASSPAHKPNSYLSAKNGDAAFTPAEKKGSAAPSVENDPSVISAPSPVRSTDWRKAKHPKILQGRPLSRKPFPAPKSQAAAEAFLLKHHVPVMYWPRLMQNLLDGQLYEFDIEPWMDVA